MKAITECESEHRALRKETILENRYQIERVLGEGGFGITYEGRQLDGDGKVAIKEYFPAAYATRNNADLDQNLHIFLTERDAYDHGMKRFLQEAELLKSVQYLDGIVSVMDCFTCNQTAYIVMEYIEGVTLKQYVLENGCLAYDELLDLLLPMMKSLHCIHRQGMIHRDISPDNILIGLDNKARLIDFGAADMVGVKGKRDITVILKAGYAPPEQYLTEGKQGTWTDVYAVAATMYMALMGKTPVDSIARLQGKELESLEHCNVKLQKWQQNAIETAMALKISDRYKDMAEFLNGLMAAPRIEDEVTCIEEDVPEKLRNQILSLNHSAKKSVWIGILCVGVIALGAWGILWLQGKNTSDTIQGKQEISQEENLLCVMPDVSGMMEQDARDEIGRVDESIQIIIKRKYSRKEKGIVLEQDVAADTQYSIGTIEKVVLTISDGEAPTTQKETTTEQEQSAAPGSSATEQSTASEGETTGNKKDNTKKKNDVKIIEEDNYDEFQLDE